jgi:hypothetical protein
MDPNFFNILLGLTPEIIDQRCRKSQLGVK